MAALPKQLKGPIYQAGAQIYGGLLPIPDTKQAEVEKAFEAFKQVCENAVTGSVVRVTSIEEPGMAPPKRLRGAPPMNDAIVAFLSPLALCTPLQILRGIKTSKPNLKIEALQARLKKDAGKPGLWIPVGNKYGMPGGTATAKARATKTTTKTADANPNVVPAPAALPGEKPQTRVLNYVIAHGGHTKNELISAFKTSPTPIKAQYVGVELSRLIKYKKITGSENGPYLPLPATKPTDATGGIGDGAAAPA